MFITVLSVYNYVENVVYKYFSSFYKGKFPTL